jgi:hypothetical protein
MSTEFRAQRIPIPTCRYNQYKLITRWSVLLSRNIHSSLPASIVLPRDPLNGVSEDVTGKRRKQNIKIRKEKRTEKSSSTYPFSLKAFPCLSHQLAKGLYSSVQPRAH